MKRLLLLFVLVPVASAAVMRAPEYVPVDRLIKNVSAVLKAKPQDPDQLFLLARLHSLAYAKNGRDTPVYFRKRGDHSSRFSIAPWIGIQLEVARTKLSNTRLAHLRKSYLTYMQVVELKPNASLPKLGWAWVSGEAAKYPKQTANFGAPQTMTAEKFTDQAIKLYREIVAAYVPVITHEDRWVGADDEPAYEAAKNLLPLLNSETLLDGMTLVYERARLRKLMLDYEAQPGLFSPIIFPLVPTPVNRLIDPARTTTFDIAADGIPRQWPWVAPQTAFLAWDPAGTGVIKDGTQLFGNRTFNMFFRDGYAALASLDNNHDGWLTGIEIRGIVVWHDRNQNGVSDRGEVLPAGRLGLTAIRTKSNGYAGGMLAASTGIRFLSGQTVPTYDWLPTSKTGALKH